MNAEHESKLSQNEVGSELQIDRDSLLAKADSYFADQDYAAAWQELNRITQTFGGSFEILAAMALCSMSLNDLERARMEYLQSVRYNPDNPEIRLNLAVVEKSLGMFNDAYHQTQIVLGLNRDDTLARKLAADINVQRERFDLALADYSIVIEKEPENIEALLGIGRTLFSLDRFQESIETYEKILNIEPNHEIAADNILVARKKLGQHRPTPFEGDRKALLEDARDAMNKGHHKKAKSLLRPLIFSSDATADICFIYGNLCLLEGSYEEALVNYTKMVDLDPEDIRGHLKLSAAAAAVGLKDLSRQHFSLAQTMDADHPDLFEIEIEVLMLEKNYLPAAQMIYQLISQDMSNANMVAKLALCFENLGDYQLASETYKKALEAQPDHPFSRESLKRIEHLVSSYKNADPSPNSNESNPSEKELSESDNSSHTTSQNHKVKVA